MSMTSDKRAIEKLLEYVLEEEKERFLDNPFQTDNIKSKTVTQTEKKLEEITEAHIEGRLQ